MPGAQELCIPVYPRFIASAIKHCIINSPSEGPTKALVNFSVRDRNLKKKHPATKNPFEKRKIVAIAFLLDADMHGIDSYEKEFWPLNSKFSAGRALEASRKFIEKESKRSSSLRNLLRDESKVRVLTNRVVAKLDLNAVIENALRKT